MQKFIPILLFHLPLLLIGQTITHQTLASGGQSSSNGLAMTMSLGQPITQFSSSPNLKLYLGFQHIVRRIETTTIKPNTYTTLHVYPNPFTDFVIIEDADYQTIDHVYLSDIVGKYYRLEFDPYHTQIDLTSMHLSAGVYMMHIVYKDNSNKTFKLLKQ